MILPTPPYPERNLQVNLFIHDLKRRSSSYTWYYLQLAYALRHFGNPLRPDLYLLIRQASHGVSPGMHTRLVLPELVLEGARGLDSLGAAREHLAVEGGKGAVEGGVVSGLEVREQLAEVQGITHGMDAALGLVRHHEVHGVAEQCRAPERNLVEMAVHRHPPNIPDPLRRRLLDDGPELWV